jgi:hypothetical protein
MIIERLATRLAQYIMAKAVIEWLQNKNLVDKGLSAKDLAVEFAFPHAQRGVVKELESWKEYQS